MSADFSYLSVSQKKAPTPRGAKDGSRSHRGEDGDETIKDRPAREATWRGLKSRRKLENYADLRSLWQKKASASPAAVIIPENQPYSRYHKDMGAKAAAKRILDREKAALKRAERRAERERAREKARKDLGEARLQQQHRPKGTEGVDTSSLAEHADRLLGAAPPSAIQAPVAAEEGEGLASDQNPFSRCISNCLPPPPVEVELSPARFRSPGKGSPSPAAWTQSPDGAGWVRRPEGFQDPEEDALPDGWVEVPDPEGGSEAYYWNQVTGETTWDRPHVEGSSEAAEAKAEAQAQQQQQYDEAVARVQALARGRAVRRAGGSNDSASVPAGAGAGLFDRVGDWMRSLLVDDKADDATAAEPTSTAVPTLDIPVPAPVQQKHAVMVGGSSAAEVAAATRSCASLEHAATAATAPGVTAPNVGFAPGVIPAKRAKPEPPQAAFSSGGLLNSTLPPKDGKAALLRSKSGRLPPQWPPPQGWQEQHDQEERERAEAEATAAAIAEAEEQGKAKARAEAELQAAKEAKAKAAAEAEAARLKAEREEKERLEATRAKAEADAKAKAAAEEKAKVQTEARQKMEAEAAVKRKAAEEAAAKREEEQIANVKAAEEAAARKAVQAKLVAEQANTVQSAVAAPAAAVAAQAAAVATQAAGAPAAAAAPAPDSAKYGYPISRTAGPLGRARKAQRSPSKAALVAEAVPTLDLRSDPDRDAALNKPEPKKPEPEPEAKPKVVTGAPAGVQTAAEKATAAKAAAEAAKERALAAKAAAEAAKAKANAAKEAALAKKRAAAASTAAAAPAQAAPEGPAARSSSDIFTVTAPPGPLGIGLASGQGGYVLVGDVQPSSMSAKAGVVVGCRLVSINGQSTKGLTTKQVTEMLKVAAAAPEPRVLSFSRPALEA